MMDVEIERTDTGNKARYTARVDGIDGEGELTLSKVSDTLIIADHTGVPDNLRGTGVAKALVERLFSDARASGQKIIPLCPFVKGYAVRHRSDVQDVIQW